jgi:hypothetical protein
VAYRGSYRPKPQKRCWCGSGKKQKNCHPSDTSFGLSGSDGDRKAVDFDDQDSGLRTITKEPKAEMKPWGVPGEGHKLWVVPVRKSDVGQPKLKGSPGRYIVHFLLSRPGFPISKEYERNFIDKLVGDSHIRIIKSVKERGSDDPDRMLLKMGGKNYKFSCFANDEGFLGKITTELTAENADDAECEAYGEITPFLSAWSLNLDIPVHIETVQVTEVSTFINCMRTTTPQFEMNWAGGVEMPVLRDEFCQYASVYREGLNSNSVFYRYLCFYKIIESLIARRGREAKQKRLMGEDPRRLYEVIPKSRDELLPLLKQLYPWRQAWDEMAVKQIFPDEILGKKVTVVCQDYLREIRLSIAHALLEPGELTIILDKMEHVEKVNKWVSPCRIVARWMLLTDFPEECATTKSTP